MSALKQFSSLVSVLYEAAADPQQWDQFLSNYYRAMDCSRGALTAISEDTELTKVILGGYTEAETRAYSEYFCQHDVVLGAGLEVVKKSNEWIGSLEEILPYRNLEDSEIYNDYYRNLNMHYATCMMVGTTGPYSALGLAAWRSKADGPFQSDQLDLAQLLAPHVKQAFVLSAKLKTLRVESHIFASALEAAAIVVIGLRTDGGVAALSGPAEAMLRRREILTLSGARLHAVHAPNDRTLQQMIAKAIRATTLPVGVPEEKALQPGGSFLLHRRGKLHPLQVQVMPARLSAGITGKEVAVLVFISDPGAVPPNRFLILRQLYQLTAVESKVADLFLQGREPKRAAEELHLSYDSVRFHLKQIFRKTNTTRQVELLRLLLALPG